jgi:hypothetical protein
MTPQRAVMTLAKHLHAQPSAGGDTEAISLALPAAVQQTAVTSQHQECPALRRPGGSSNGPAETVHKLAERRRSTAHDGPKNSSSVTKVWTNVSERKRSSEGTGGDGAGVVLVPRESSAPASTMNTL